MDPIPTIQSEQPICLVDPQAATNLPGKSIKLKPIELPMDPYFEERFEVLWGLSSGRRLIRGALPDLVRSKHPDYDLINLANLNFQHLFRESFGHFHPTMLREAHSELPVVLYYSKQEPNSGVLRILKLSDQSYVNGRQYERYFSCLSKAIQYLHQRLSKKLGLSREDHQRRLMVILSWLTLETIDPTEGIPILGAISDATIEAHWGKGQVDRQVLFRPAQLAMISYFSKVRPKVTYVDEAYRTAAYVVGRWYQRVRPKDFENLVNLKAHK
jgi:hypothetical protein